MSLSNLAGVTADQIRTDPFPHIVIPNVMEAAAYEALAAGFPPSTHYPST